MKKAAKMSAVIEIPLRDTDEVRNLHDKHEFNA